MKEQWAKIPEYPDYEISNNAEIFRVGKTKRIQIKVCADKGSVYACLKGPKGSHQVNVKRILNMCFEDHVYKDHEVDDLPGEVWRDVVGWENSHEVSNLGRIRTKERTRASKQGSVSYVVPKIKETYLDEDGYERVCLYEDNRNKLLGVHRIVAEAFVPNPENLPQVNHKNGLKADNSESNLEWVTGQSNIQHSIEAGLRDPHVYSIPIIRVEDNKIFNSIAELHREIGGSYNGVAHMLKALNPGETACIQGRHYKYATQDLL